MREFKFKVFRKSNGKFLGIFDLKELKADCAQNTGLFVNCPVEDCKITFDDVILKQYTGFKDKNDTEIYEGDSLNHIDNMVEFSGGCWNINGDRPLSYFASSTILLLVMNNDKVDFSMNDEYFYEDEYV